MRITLTDTKSQSQAKATAALQTEIDQELKTAKAEVPNRAKESAAIKKYTKKVEEIEIEQEDHPFNPIPGKTSQKDF